MSVLIILTIRIIGVMLTFLTDFLLLNQIIDVNYSEYNSVVAMQQFLILFSMFGSNHILLQETSEKYYKSSTLGFYDFFVAVIVTSMMIFTIGFYFDLLLLLINYFIFEYLRTILKGLNFIIVAELNLLVLYPFLTLVLLFITTNIYLSLLISSISCWVLLIAVLYRTYLNGKIKLERFNGLSNSLTLWRRSVLVFPVTIFGNILQRIELIVVPMLMLPGVNEYIFFVKISLLPLLILRAIQVVMVRRFSIAGASLDSKKIIYATQKFFFAILIFYIGIVFFCGDKIFQLFSLEFTELYYLWPFILMSRYWLCLSGGAVYYFTQVKQELHILKFFTFSLVVSGLSYVCFFREITLFSVAISVCLFSFIYCVLCYVKIVTLK